MNTIPPDPSSGVNPSADALINILLPFLILLLIGSVGISGWLALNIYGRRMQPSGIRTSRPLQSAIQNQQGFRNVTEQVSPTPTPLQGDGKHACDFLGICNVYDDPTSKGCPVTFADPDCLHQCNDVSKRCPQTKPK